MANREELLKGLSAPEVAHSRTAEGSNSLTQKPRKTFLKGLVQNFGDPMIKILLIALAINIIVLHKNINWLETMGIVFAILIAVVVSAISEAGSERAFEKLQKNALNTTARVRRDGKTMEIPVADIVVGDIVILSAGDKVPADGDIISGELEVDQSALNGESKEAKKFAARQNSLAAPSSDLLDPKRLFSGTVVTSGTGFMQVKKVGDKTFYGGIAAELQESTPDSPLKIKLTELAKKISGYGYIGAGLVAFSYLFNVIFIDSAFVGAQILAALKFRTLFPHLVNATTLAVSVIVMAVPEGLPMMITIVLSTNMKRMMDDNVLVRKLSGIETAGGLNILFTDKTGTLTSGKLTVKNIISGDGQVFLRDDVASLGGIADILAVSLRHNNGAEMSNTRAVGGNATDRVLLEYAHFLPTKYKNTKTTKQTPFSSVTKYSSAEIRGDAALTLYKGAPERLVDKCTRRYTQSGAIVPLAPKDKYNLSNAIDGIAECGGRMIAVAVSERPSSNIIENNLILVAVIGIRDNIREGATRGVMQVVRAGVQVVMITGDAKSTATAIARETGILTGDKTELVITSAELASMSDRELADCLSKIRVVARALPSDKSRLVRAAQALGLVAGMTGDGINDAPALKIADIGFAMGSGTEVAKEAGDIIILDDNILSISRAVSYGRTIFKSIRKFIIFQLSINFCAVAVSVIAPMLNIDTPITVLQMLWINLVMDTLAGLAFGGEKPREKYMSEAPKRRDEPIINNYMKQQIAVSSTYAAFVCLWFLLSGNVQRVFAPHGEVYALTAFFALFMFMAIFNSLSARTHEVNLLDHLALNKQFIWIMSSVTLLQIALIYFGGQAFRTEPLNFMHLVAIVLLSFTVVPIDLIRKKLAKKKGGFGGT